METSVGNVVRHVLIDVLLVTSIAGVASLCANVKKFCNSADSVCSKATRMCAAGENTFNNASTACDRVTRLCGTGEDMLNNASTACDRVTRLCGTGEDMLNNASTTFNSARLLFDTTRVTIDEFRVMLNDTREEWNNIRAQINAALGNGAPELSAAMDDLDEVLESDRAATSVEQMAQRVGSMAQSSVRVRRAVRHEAHRRTNINIQMIVRRIDEVIRNIMIYSRRLARSNPGIGLRNFLAPEDAVRQELGGEGLLQR